MGCGLNWTVPAEWRDFSREHQAQPIRQAIRREMECPQIDTGDLECLLDALAARTLPGWRHRFHTTNWDYLLQTENSARFAAGTLKPRWLASSHVYHHNGTAQPPFGNPFRSKLLLESDPRTARTPSPESNIAFQQLVYSHLFIVVGMSFECAVDRFLLTVLNRVGKDLQVGESVWIVVNPDANTLNDSCSKIRAALPSASVCARMSTFRGWINQRFPELVYRRVLTA